MSLIRTVTITVGLDRAFRVTSTISDEFGCEFSQGSVAKKSKSLGIKAELLKLPAVVDFSSETVREEDWDGVVTCHQGGNYARTWSYKNKAIGKKTLTPVEENFGAIRTVALSACGKGRLLWGLEIGLHDWRT